jgi:hypothetical protein
MPDEESTPPSPPRRSRRRRWAIRGALFAAYLLLMTFGSCVDHLILFPSNQPVPVPGCSRIAVTPGPDKNAEVEVWSMRTPAVAPTSQPKAFVLAFIGNADRAEYAVQRNVEDWADWPVEVWAVNYPGYGGSTGPARLAAIGPAVLAAYDSLRAIAGARPIFVSGMSLGTAAALHVSANRPVAGLVLQNPPPLRKMILERYGWWNLWLIAGPAALHIPSDLDSLANARRTTAPGVFLLAQEDHVVPPRFARAVVAAYAGEKRVIPLPGADHNDSPAPAQEAELHAAIGWLWDRSVGR